MPISVKATFAQDGVFFAGEKLNCTITFTNSSPTSSTFANGNHGSAVSRPPSLFQHKLQALQEHQPQPQGNGLGKGQGMNKPSPSSNASSRDKSIANMPTISTTPPSLSLLQNVPSNAHVRPGAALLHGGDTISGSNGGVSLENGSRTRLQSEISQLRPSPANRTTSQPRMSSDISHIDAISREQAESNGKGHRQERALSTEITVLMQGTADREQDDQEEHEQEQIIAAPSRRDDNTATQSPTSPTSRQHQLTQQQQQQAYVHQEGPQETISSPGLLGLATFMYRSASFSSLASAFGLSGGDHEIAAASYGTM
ncbi:hypothetical protein BGX28_007780 [Mortierella sp. GBA30]|nr:hypothetical protein BGX28_007780 [Mortierella sp. GBA30]